MKTVVEKQTGKVIYLTAIEVEISADQFIIDDYPQGEFNNPYYDFTKKLFYEGVPVSEVAPVPLEVALWRIRTILKLNDKQTIIEDALNSLEDPIKTAALNIWQFGTTIERQSQTVVLLQGILQMTDEQVDEIFIEANNIQL
ncbi:hypothetical protein [Flavobacterium sp. N1994]|uniref:hypothetical protein n=1 Tax=Flavobacterium sp. N1994 TaxID=2986827 RepID=UPI002223A690|nr:hypothetical protein [Flavobacterium sp. N1994]